MRLWDKLHDMNENQLADYAERHHVDMAQQFNDLRAAADFVCAELGVPRISTEQHDGEELDRLAQTYMHQHRCGYIEALNAVRRANPDVDKAYVESFGLEKAPLKY